MAFDLENHLRELCEGHDPVLDLHDRIRDVRRAADAIWELPRLHWFTDHRSQTHSRNIVLHLGALIESLQRTSQALSPHELFVLLASTYLHDIGMQDMTIDGRGMEALSIQDYEDIRARHPKRAKELIIQRFLKHSPENFSVGLDGVDDVYIAPIALVAQGHGSAFFEDTVEELRGLPNSPGNERFRGDLLTALLLMGDELDLHENRATFPKEMYLSPISALHHHVHHYIARVDTIDGSTPKTKRIKLTFQFPTDSEEYRNEVRQWVVAKLIRQSRRTSLVIRAGTQGELDWDTPLIEVHVSEDAFGLKRRLPEGAHRQLSQEVLDADTVDRQDVIDALRATFIKCGEEYRAIELVTNKESEWPHLLRCMIAMCNLANVRPIHISLHIATAGDPLDLLQRIRDQLNGCGLSCPQFDSALLPYPQAPTSARADIARLWDSLTADIGSHISTHPIALLLDSVDRSEPNTREWIVDEMLPSLRAKSIPMVVVLTSGPDPTRGSLVSNESDRFVLANFEKQQILEHYSEKLGYGLEDARHAAEVMHMATNGAPQRVLSTLWLREAREVVRLG